MLIKKNTFTTDAAARRVALLSGARGLRTKYLGALKARIIKKRHRMQQGGHHTSIDIAGLGGGAGTNNTTQRGAHHQSAPTIYWRCGDDDIPMHLKHAICRQRIPKI